MRFSNINCYQTFTVHGNARIHTVAYSGELMLSIDLQPSSPFLDNIFMVVLSSFDNNNYIGVYRVMVLGHRNQTITTINNYKLSV